MKDAGSASPSLDGLLRRADLWRAGGTARPSGTPAPVPTGFAALDARLPVGGWPVGALIEVLAEHRGIGELRLLVPALASLASAGRRIVLAGPPWLPYAPALAGHGIDPGRVLVVRARDAAHDTWAAEQALRSGACGAVLLWEGTLAFSDRQLRRFQLAAEAGGALGVVFRERAAARQRSPAALRLAVAPAKEGTLVVRVLKCRGGAAGASITLRV